MPTGPSVSAWAREAMNWAVAQGLITGKSGGRLDPGGTASRAEVSAILMRYVQSARPNAFFGDSPQLRAGVNS